ncbi:bud site selection protein [Porites harrisoni]
MAAISKQEYLKRYLSNSDSGKKKKKRKIPKVASKRPTSIIVDDDITLEDVKVNHEENEMNEFEVDADETPAVYEDDGVTKISLETFKKREEDQRNKWAPINKNTQLSPSKEVGQKSNYDSDYSPPRIMKRRRQDTPDLSPRGGLMANSPDQSPLRNRYRRIEADNSPPRSRRRHDSGDSIPEEVQNQLHVHDRSTTSRIRNDSPDLSPLWSGPNSDSTARRVRNDSPDLSPPRLGSNRDSGGRRFEMTLLTSSLPNQEEKETLL